MEADLLTRKTAAAKLGISTRQLFNITKAGRIAHVRLGDGLKGSVRYRAEDLQAFINSRTVHAIPSSH